MASPIMDSYGSFGSSGMISPRHVRSRTQSISSDRPSTVGFGLVLPPLSVSPESCFIAHSAASQIITNDHDSHADAWYDQNGIEPAGESATISGPALKLVNGFLDQLLFNFLQLSKSTSLSALRPAVIEVLKPKLAKDAISNAEEELREYLGGANEDDYAQPNGSNASRDWDLELAWKRTRLRCMVYSSLGDMEEEDEDMYMEEENLELGTNEQISDIVSPAVAIFLTSVLEYMGELALTVAGQAAYQRVRAKIEKELKEGSHDGSYPADRIVVSDSDMERVALDRTLGRLWRGWKKRMRTPTTDVASRPSSRTLSIPSKLEPATMGQALAGLPKFVNGDYSSDHRKSQDHLEPPIIEDVPAADIPLPLTDNDVNEIEVPGLVNCSDDEADVESDQEEEVKKRPKSQSLSYSVIANSLPKPTRSQPLSPLRAATRKRSLSLPSRTVPNFFPRAKKQSQISALDADVIQERATESTDTEQGKYNDKTLDTRPKVPQPITDDGQSDLSEYDDAAEEVTYDEAEIMESSPLSLTDSSHSVDYDTNSKSSPRKRSSSVHSPRIIDVSAPKSTSPRSSAHSRPGLLDETNKSRPVILSGIAVAAVLAGATAAQEASKPQESRSANSAVVEGAAPETSVAIAKLPLQTTSIPETDESVMEGPARRLGPSEVSPGATTAPAAGGIIAPAKSRNRDLPVTINTKTQAHVYEQTPISARAVPVPATPANPAIEEESLSGPLRKAPAHVGRQSPKTESKGLLTIERTRTHESDEVSSSLQTSSNARHAHTAASSVSSAASRLKPVRTSEEDSSRSESVARNFEELIQSNQTITYTLTPENMRDVDSKSPVVTKFARRKSEDVRNGPKLSPIATQSSARGLPSPRLPPGPNSPKAVESKSFTSKTSGPVSWAATGLASSIGRDGGTAAREARVPPDTTSDFAEFIKSTGPADESNAYAVPKLASPVSPGRDVKDLRRASTTSSLSRSRYQPRDAAIESKADNSDLIDFIRQGPPIASSNPRIPRHVAPFRTTMDSDQMSGAIGGKAVDASIPDIRTSQGSTNVTESSLPSVPSSINSRSALLRKKVAPTGKPSNVPGGEDSMMLVRKTRRVRDPYAIDFSDEEEDDDESDNIMQTHRVAAKKEESLAEFLRNCEPPPEPVSATPRIPRKKASAPSLMGRFTRGGKDKEKDAAFIKGGQDTGSVHSRTSGPGYIPIQVNIPAGYDKHGPVGASPSSVNRMRGPSTASSSAARIPMRKFEPREAVTNRSQTADLAAFLRTSAPPPSNSPVSIDRSPSRQEELGGGNGGISKMFGRKKKTLPL